MLSMLIIKKILPPTKEAKIRRIIVLQMKKIA
jgi:hypothetical protein